MRQLIKTIIILTFLLNVNIIWPAEYERPKEAKKVTFETGSFSWDINKGKWYELKATMVLTELYDSKGNILSGELTHQKAVVLEKNVYEYTASGWKKTTFNPQKEIIRTTVAEKTGNKIKETTFRADGSLFSVNDIKLNSKSIILETKQYDDENQELYRIVYSYDEKGNLKKSLYYNEDGSIAFQLDYEYSTFDTKGNWTTRNEYYTYLDVYHRPKEVIHRTIEY